jgi:hypothetical protein
MMLRLVQEQRSFQALQTHNPTLKQQSPNPVSAPGALPEGTVYIPGGEFSMGS